MKHIYHDDSFTLHTDLYQINMAETYWRDGIHKKRAVFELYFRKLPFGNGYAVFAGLEKVIQFIQGFRFSEEDLEYLKNEVGYKDDFIDYLKE
ncbi:nicotinate phosphoribosyltransferase, partial [Alkalihalophilus lindianensis]|nr:nicotinate phosphoribosyltransferase [Alkalihalophilus lindianensis]